MNGRRSLFTGTELSMQYFGGDSRKIKHLAPYWPLKRISMKGYCSTWTFFFSWWWRIIHSVWRWPLPVRGNIDLQLVLYWRFFHFLEKLVSLDTKSPTLPIPHVSWKKARYKDLPLLRIYLLFQTSWFIISSLEHASFPVRVDLASKRLCKTTA